MLASLMRHQVIKMITIITSYIFLSDYILIFCTHLFGNTKDVFFIVFNTSKLLLFWISFSCVDGIFCFPFCFQIFIFAPTSLSQSSLLRYIVTDLFIPPICLLSLYAFISVAESKPYFNIDRILSTCSPEMSLISPVKVSQNLSRRSACWSFHTRRFGTHCLERSSLFTILASQTMLGYTLFIWDDFDIMD